MEEKLSPIEVDTKVMAVINSCLTFEQTLVAKEMIINHYKIYNDNIAYNLFLFYLNKKRKEFHG